MTGQSTRRREQYAWLAGIVYVAALIAEIAVGASLGIKEDDSASKIVRTMHEHRDRLLLTAYIAVVYAVAFSVYLAQLHQHVRSSTARVLSSLVLIGGVLFVAFHAVSDIGITGLLGAKLATYGAAHDPAIPYTLFLMTFALDSVGGVFSSLFLVATGVLVMRSGLLPRRLGWVAVVGGIAAFLQGFGLGGVISPFGLVLELIGFVLLLLFVLASSIVSLRRGASPPPHAAPNPA